MKYIKPTIDKRLFRHYSIYDMVSIIDKVGYNHNHNRLCTDLLKTKIYRESWVAIKRKPLLHLKPPDIWAMRQRIKDKMWAIEDKIKAKSPDPYKTKKFPDDIDIDLLKQILALSAKHLFHDIWPAQQVKNVEEHLQALEDRGYGAFRFGINKGSGEGFIPTLEAVFYFINNSIKHYNNSSSSLEEKKAEWNAFRTVGVFECIWGCVETGLVSQGEFIGNTLLKMLECPDISDNKERRSLSTYLALGALYLSIPNKKKAYEAFSKVPPMMCRFEQNPQIGYIFWRVAQTRCVEAAIEMYKLRPTAKNRSLCNELYLRSLLSYFGEGQDSDPWEAVRERILITLMLVKHVYKQEI